MTPRQQAELDAGVWLRAQQSPEMSLAILIRREQHATGEYPHGRTVRVRAFRSVLTHGHEYHARRRGLPVPEVCHAGSFVALDSGGLRRPTRGVPHHARPYRHRSDTRAARAIMAMTRLAGLTPRETDAVSDALRGLSHKARAMATGKTEGASHSATSAALRKMRAWAKSHHLRMEDVLCCE